MVSNQIFPEFSCMPKTHKPGNKVRPVVSSVDAPTSKIRKCLIKSLEISGSLKVDALGTA
jgi:hypothetical protein